MLEVIDRRINKSSTFRVYQIDQSRYKVTNQMKNGIVNLENKVVVKELKYQYYSAWVSSYFTMETYRSTYVEVVFPMPVSAEYEEPDEVMVVLLPLMDKQHVERPKIHNRIPSQGEGPITKNVDVAKGSVILAKTVTLHFP
uniref:Uncharacterized protein n=1 Tax=Lactuca sativa TaxID=4236 RepID=A0A9R1X054_LACSA|nr:hypothetical protein LSAT_V11C800452130 [Lactuca sativa]